jgi:hypothetical protein
MRSAILAHFGSNCINFVRLILTPAFEVGTVVFWNPSEDFYEEKVFGGILLRLNWLSWSFQTNHPDIPGGTLPSDVLPGDAWQYIFCCVEGSLLLIEEVC